MNGERQGRSALARAAEVVGILAAAVGIAVGLWTIFHRESTEVPDYQRQVLATCQQVHKILSAEHHEILTIDPHGGGNSPEDMFRVRKDVLLQVLENNLAQTRQAFDALNEQDIPKSLNTRHQAAVAAQDAWYGAVGQTISTVRDKLPENARLGRLRQLGVELGGGGETANVRLNSAMTALAGENCQVTT